MAATHTVTSNPQLITVGGTSDETVDIDAVFKSGEVLIEYVSGTAIQFNTMGAVVSASGTLSATNTKFILPVQRGDYIHHKGGAGSETYLITGL